MLIDFIDAQESQRWIAINDDVMGGISQSRIKLSPAATALFIGQTTRVILSCNSLYKVVLEKLSGIWKLLTTKDIR